MHIVNPEDIRPLLNKCYPHYDPLWGKVHDGVDGRMRAFKYYIEREAGLKLEYALITKVDPYTGRQQYGFNIVACEVVDENQFLLFQIKWS